MNARVVVLAAALLASGSAFAADPAGPPSNQPDQAQAQAHRAAVLLASADHLAANPADQQQAQPIQRRARVGRVTTCRCGDQQDQPDE